MAIKSLKIGKFKPTCTGCKEVFVLKIEDADPPKIKVGKLPIEKLPTENLSPEKSPSEKLPSEVLTEPPATHRFQNSLPSEQDPNAEETMPERRPTDVTRPQAKSEFMPIVPADETLMHGDANLPSSPDATIDQDMGVTVDPAAFLNASIDYEVTSDPQSTVALATNEATMEYDAPVEATLAPPTRDSRADDFSVDSKPATEVGGDKTRIESRASGSDKVPDRLGGYRILKELGRGGMGSVYLARQLSLDRQVALKTIQAIWASNPRVIARFIREAYAAAQLTHHNVVQIYDLGEEKGVNFFSMELVRGGSLDDLLKSKGKVDARTAALYVLQAARGLKFAHDHGMVHRDIKPANLMLTQDELVKIADLGLVKTPTVEEGVVNDEERNVMLASANSRVTGVGSTMGTPAYMSPEQADDAANVDLRADIYSLGCTFYALLTGGPPFTSDSALEVITKHRTSRVERPDHIMEGIPSELGVIVEKMTARDAQDRYQNLADTIRDLEKYLSSDATQTLKPQQDHVARLDQAARDFHAAPAVRLRKLFPLIFLATCGVLLLLGGLASFSSWLLSFRCIVAVLCFFIATPMAIGCLAAIEQGSSPIGSRVRSLIASSSWGDRGTWLVGSLMSLLVAYFLGLLVWCLVAIGLAIGVAFLYRSMVSRPLRLQRTQSLTNVDRVLRDLRTGGLSESAIQRFVADNGGKGWEELFEQVYDYDSLQQARRDLAASGRVKGKYRYQPWRDSLIQRMDEKILQAQQRHEQRILEKVERANLKASGVSESQARQQAAELASSMVQVAAENRQKSPSLFGGGSDEAAAAKRERIKQMLQAARTGKPKTLGSLARKTTSAMLGHLFGAKLRFLCGVALLLGCVAWANQNGLLDASKLEEVSKVNLGPNFQGQANEIAATFAKELKSTKALQWPIVGGWFTSFAPGMMGLLLIGSALIYGWRYSIFAISAGAITLLGPGLMIEPVLGSMQGASWLAFGLGFLILVVGLALGRQKT